MCFRAQFNADAPALLTMSCVGISCVFVSLTAQAQSEANESIDGIDTLPTLSIEANAEAPAGNIEHEDFAGRYTRLEGDTLNRNDIDLGDVLSFEAGVQQQQVGGFASFSTISVRGSTPQQTSVFLDGIRLNGASNAVVDLSTFDLRSFSSIDIYRGAAPLQLGATNIGGAVNLNTLESAENTTLVKLTYGSFGTVQSNLSHQSTHGPWRIVATADAGQSDNDFRLLNDNTTPLNPNDDQVERRNNADVRFVSVLGKLAYQHSENTSTDVLLQHNQRSTGVPEFRNSPDNVASFTEGRGQLHLSHRVKSYDGWSQRHTAFAQWVDDNFDDSLSQVGLGAQDFRSQQRVIGASTYWDRFSFGGKWAFTAEARREIFDAEDPFGQDPSTNASRNSLTGAFGYTRFAFNDRLTVTPRLRVENHSSDFDGGNLDSQSDGNDFILNPEFSVRFEQNKKLTWIASVGRYFRLPTFSEMFGTQGLIVSNEDLLPEEGVNTEIGVELLAHQNLTLKATVFNSDRDNAILTIFDARGIGRNSNTGGARVTGLELESQWQATKKLQVQANLTLQDSTNNSDIASFQGQQLPNQAARTAYARVSYDLLQSWRLWSEVNVIQDRFFDSGNLLPAENATTFNLGALWQRGNWRTDLTLNNITGQKVEDFNGFPRPGRAFSLSAAYRFM